MFRRIQRMQRIEWIMKRLFHPFDPFDPMYPSTPLEAGLCRVRLAVAGLLLTIAGTASAQSGFRVEETSIAQIHAAITGGTLSCRQLVEQYLRRIEAYDKNGPAVNALVVVNPAAREVADSLDRRFRNERRLVGPLHCIPMIVKDNFETIDLPVTAGSLSLKGYLSSRDAFLVKRIREA